MKKRVLGLNLYLLVVGYVNAQAQISDVSIPKQRENFVQSAVELWEQRGVALAVPDPAPNPFQFPVEAPTEPNDAVASPTIPVVTGADLLVQLAARIPASGTVLIGGESILLLGQKRLKVGDTVTISFEGKSYDLSLEAIGSTTFTIRLGSLIHTRSTYISSSSRP